MDYQNSHIANTYARFPIEFVKGKGALLFDRQGNEYLDFVSGIAVCSLGHCHPAVTRAITQQAETLMHVSNLYWTEPQLELAQAICDHSFGERVFFCNSGAEAVESALKLARRRGKILKGPECFEVICLKGSFHGRTMTALSATGQPVYQHGFEPLTPGFKHIPPNNIQALELAVGPRTAAVLVEPVMGEGGVIPLSDDFLKAARELCDTHNCLLIFDEVQVGMGRTGTLFAYEQTPVVPDAMCLAKALANGFPIGAMVATGEAMEFLPPGTHASTFGGNPLACAAAKAVLDTMLEPGFLENVRETGQYFRQGLEAIASSNKDKVKECRGRGMIQAIELAAPQPDLAMQILEDRCLVLLGHGRILRFLPPLIVTRNEVDRMLEVVEKRLAQIA